MLTLKQLAAYKRRALVECMLFCVCRGAAAAVIVFDITSKDSFAKAKSWIKELQRQVCICC